jgi:hypothetical protein
MLFRAAKDATRKGCTGNLEPDVETKRWRRSRRQELRQGGSVAWRPSPTGRPAVLVLKFLRTHSPAREQGHEGHEGHGSLSACAGPAQGRGASLTVAGIERAPYQIRHIANASAAVSTRRRGASTPSPVPTYIRPQVAVEGWRGGGLMRRDGARVRWFQRYAASSASEQARAAHKRLAPGDDF